VAVPDVADEEMLEVGVESLQRGLKLFPDNLYQVINNVWEDMYEAAPSHSQQSARITEQDAWEIAESLEYYFDNIRQEFDFSAWWGSKGRELLDKLNADRCPSHESEQGGCHE
jgi:hypothetical protein